MRFEVDRSDPLSHFIMVLVDWNDSEHPANILSRSGSFCRMPASWEFQPHPKGTKCIVKINNLYVASAIEPVKNDARDMALKMAILNMSKRCYTIRVKSQVLSDGTKVDFEEVTEGKAKDKTELGGGNMGHKLLKLMGWTGGGLGKGGSGISEPITATAITNREGLGSTTTGREFKNRVRTIIEEYAASSNPYDLVFSAGFDNEQRKEMHT